MVFPIITKKEANKLLTIEDDYVNISLDLGISISSVLVKKGFAYIKEQKIPLCTFNNLKDGRCYLIENNTLKQIAFFSNETNFYYKLVPTKDWPTVTISSTPMNRHTKISPKLDTQLKIKEINPIKGAVLDTCCGLGYTAILSSKKAEKVYTFEKDKNILFIARLNPYSQELFSNKRILLYEEDVFDQIKRFKDASFDRVIHDPMTFKYSPELYSIKFYSELFRVFKKNGVSYFYCPSPKKTKGIKFYPKIMKKLKEAGFEKIKYHKYSSGIRALKLKNNSISLM